MPRIPAPRLFRRLRMEQLERREVLSVTFVDSGQEIGGTYVRGAAFGDLNGDGTADAFVLNNGEPDQIWFNDGDGRFIDTGQRLRRYAIQMVALGDLDGDDDLDAVLASEVELPSIWLNDGTGFFHNHQQHLIVAEVTQPVNNVALADMDADGDYDVVSHGLVQFNDGDAYFASQPPLPICSGDNFRIHELGDMDHDGDVDALGLFGLVTVGVCRNVGTKSEPEFMRVDAVRSDNHAIAASLLDMGDINGDGHPDILATDSSNQVSFFLNDGDGSVTSSDYSQIELPELDGHVQSVLADFDADGDLDVIVVHSSGESHSLKVWPNDGAGGFGLPSHTHDMPANPMGYSRPILVDVDEDGDLDIFAQGRILLWADDYGDTNRDGQFNQLDIVQVLQSAKFLTGESATWSEGDWNGDGVFDQLDIIAALQTGRYLKRPDAALMVKSEADPAAADELFTDPFIA